MRGKEGEYTKHKVPGSMWFYDTASKQCFVEKENSVSEAKFADNFLKIPKD